MKIDKCRAYESLLRGETEHQQLFNALSDQQTTQQSKEYATPSELPQGEYANRVSLAMNGELAFAEAEANENR